VLTFIDFSDTVPYTVVLAAAELPQNVPCIHHPSSVIVWQWNGQHLLPMLGNNDNTLKM
jgi:hypothetical protein